MVNHEPHPAFRRHTQGAFTIPVAAFLLAVALALAASPDSGKTVSPLLPSQQSAVPASATQGESVWVRILVPFGAALGGAAAGAVLGALLNWRFNRALENDRRTEAEATRRRVLLFESIDSMQEGLVRVFLALEQLRGYMNTLPSTLRNRDLLVAHGRNLRKELTPLPGTPPELVESGRAIAASFALLDLCAESDKYTSAVDSAHQLAASVFIRRLVLLKPFGEELQAVLAQARDIGVFAIGITALLAGDWPDLVEPLAKGVADLSAKCDEWRRDYTSASDHLQEAALPQHHRMAGEDA